MSHKEAVEVLKALYEHVNDLRDVVCADGDSWQSDEFRALISKSAEALPIIEGAIERFLNHD
jgi:hypothetical protein